MLDPQTVSQNVKPEKKSKRRGVRTAALFGGLDYPQPSCCWLPGERRDHLARLCRRLAHDLDLQQAGKRERSHRASPDMTLDDHSELVEHQGVSFLWSPVDSDTTSRSWLLVMASLTAVFLRFAVVTISFVLPSLVATVDTAPQVSPSAVEQPIVLDEPAAWSRQQRCADAGRQLFGATRRVETRLRPFRPVSSESRLLVHAPAGAPSPALLRPPRHYLPQVGSRLLARRLVGEKGIQCELLG